MAQQQIQIPKYLQTLISQGEHQQLDFKYAVNDAHKIAITLCAFANTDGGTLLIGVKDNGSIAGCKLEEDGYMIELAAERYCRPAVKFKIQGWKASDRYVLEVKVEKCLNKPCMAQDTEGKWLAYLRSADENFPAPSVLLRYWKLDERNVNEKYFHTEKEQRLQSALKNDSGLTVNQLSKATGIPRQAVSALLSKFLRWELVEMNFSQGIARYKVKNEEAIHVKKNKF